MASPLVDTKLYAPRLRPGLVARPQLIERLARGAVLNLTLISAPAGFGKTTLLAEWLASLPAGERSVGWLSLDEADSEPATFWTYLISALQTAASRFDTWRALAHLTERRLLRATGAGYDARSAHGRPSAALSHWRDRAASRAESLCAPERSAR